MLPTQRPACLLIHADCLSALHERATQQEARFDLVYVDPPFNAGGVRRARRASGARAQGEHAYSDHWNGIDAFIAMLEPRLAAMRDVMSETSSLWLHLDHRTIHDAKVTADRVFGRDKFVGEIIWIPGNGGRRRHAPSVTHQTIVIYSKAREMIWNSHDPQLREPYAATSQEMHFRHVDAAGRRFREREIGGKTYRYYADAGRLLGSVWSDCPAMRANTPLIAETTGYPTQKPLKLLERIVRAASLPTSLVLDPMCGSGTTLVAAGNLGRASVGIDQSEVAQRIAQERLAGVSQQAHAVETLERA